MLETLDIIEKCIGQLLTKKLLSNFSGSQLYIPYTPKPSSRLVMAIGMDAAMRLSNTLSGEWVRIPSSGPKTKQLRNKAMAQASRDGMSVQEIAAKFDMSDAQVRNILKVYL